MTLPVSSESRRGPLNPSFSPLREDGFEVAFKESAVQCAHGSVRFFSSVRIPLCCEAGRAIEAAEVLVMAGGGNRRSREAIVAARERERNVVQLYIRGLTWFEIARQLQLTGESGARAAFNRAIKRIPKGDVELLRKLEGERITDLRRRIWSELAGRADAEGNTVRPEPELVVDLVDRAIGVAFVQHTAALSEAANRQRARGRGPLPAFSALTLSGPYNGTGTGDTPSRRRLFVCHPANTSQEAACANQILSTLARRAYRRKHRRSERPALPARPADHDPPAPGTPGLPGRPRCPR